MGVNKIKRGRPKGSIIRLTPDLILNRMKKIMKKDGKIPSIRKLASVLNVDAMAIYHYFSNKNHLLEAVTISLIKEVYTPSVEDNWEEELKRLCKSYLKLLHDYPGLLEIILKMESIGPAEIFMERFHLAISPLNLDGNNLKNGVDLLADYLHGFAMAMNCNPNHPELSIDSADGPLNFYIKALASSKD